MTRSVTIRRRGSALLSEMMPRSSPDRKKPARTKRPKNMRVRRLLPRPSTGTTNTPADRMAIVAQKYAGFFTGKDYSFDQQSPYKIVSPNQRGVHVSKKAWKEPVVVADDCQFCERLDDESAIRRVAGYQHQIDIEVTNASNKRLHFNNWLRENGPNVVAWTEDSQGVVRGDPTSAANLRAFIEEAQDVPRVTAQGVERPTGWLHKALPLVKLPLRLKRKLCIEWNHIYTDYLKDNPGIYYDFEEKAFFEEMPELGPAECCGGLQAYTVYDNITIMHKEGCKTRPFAVIPARTELSHGILAMIIALSAGEIIDE